MIPSRPSATTCQNWRIWNSRQGQQFETSQRRSRREMWDNSRKWTSTDETRENDLQQLVSEILGAKAASALMRRTPKGTADCTQRHSPKQVRNTGIQFEDAFDDGGGSTMINCSALSQPLCFEREPMTSWDNAQHISNALISATSNHYCCFIDKHRAYPKTVFGI